jgi:chromosome segregation ATPase
MQQMQDRPPAEVGEPSRRRPPRRRTAAPTPIPESAQRLPRSVRLQNVLEAHLAAVDERIDQGIRALRSDTAEAIRQAATELRAASPARNGMTAQADALRGVLGHAEERFQAITLRLQRMEGALRQLARAQRQGPQDPRLLRGILDRLNALAKAVAQLGAAQHRATERLVESHHQAVERLAEEHRRAIERLGTEQRLVASWLVEQQQVALADLGKRMGRGVAAVAQRLQQDLAGRLERLEVRGPAAHERGEPALDRDPAPQDVPTGRPPPQ